MRTGRGWLCVGPVLCCLLDGALTLLGQPDAYWAGDYDQARELNPLGLWPLQRHPLLFGATLLVWAAAFCTGIVRLPGQPARALSFAVQFGHTLGAASWLVRLGVPGWLLCVPLLVASRAVLDWAWRSAAPSGAARPGEARLASGNPTDPRAGPA